MLKDWQVALIGVRGIAGYEVGEVAFGGPCMPA